MMFQVIAISMPETILVLKNYSLVTARQRRFMHPEKPLHARREPCVAHLVKTYDTPTALPRTDAEPPPVHTVVRTRGMGKRETLA